MTPNSRRLLRFALLLIILIGTGFRVHAVLENNPLDGLYSDPGRHWKHAIETIGFDPLKGIDPLGYQLWLGMVAKLTIADPWAIGIYAALMTILTPWLWYRFARELFLSKEIALLCYAVITWMPSWLEIFSYFMPETLLLPLLGASMWACWRAMRKRDLQSLTLATVLCTATVLTKLIPLPILVVCLGMALWRQEKRLKASAAVAAIIFVMLFPAAYRTHKILHIWGPFGYPGMNTIYYRSGCRELRVNLTDGNYKYMFGFASPHIGQRPLAPLSGWQTSRTKTVEVFVDMRYGTEGWNAALEENSTANWGTLWKENLIFLLAAESWPDNNPVQFWARAEIHWRWMWFVLIPLNVLGTIVFVLRTKRFHIIPVATTMMVFALVLQTTAYVEGRYRKPIEGLLVINAIWLVTAFSRRIEPSSGHSLRLETEKI